MEATLFADALVVGAGPAGLGAALGLARKGVDVAVLEVQERLGSRRRGETIRFDREMDALLGGGFFEKQTIRKICRRTYFSHSGLRRVDRTIKNPNLIISWPDFIQAMADVAIESGVRILTSSNVTGLLQDGERITGVRAVTGRVLKEDLKAKTVFSCGGCDDPSSRLLKIDRTAVDMPVLKQIVQGYSGPRDCFEYHFHLHGDGLSIGTIFPRAEGEAEIILLSHAWGRRAGPVSFEEFTGNHDLFRKRLQGTVPSYIAETAIPMGGMIFPCCPRDGLVMAGDALGHVQARGGSGIRTAFLIGYTAGSLAAEVVKSGEWSGRTTKMLEKEIRKSPPMKGLMRHNLIYSTLRAGIFGRMRGPEEMDRYWPLLKIALR